MDIETKIKEILQDPDKRKTFLGYEELDTTPKKLIDCAHEIVFSVEANILEQNEKHENIKSTMIHKTTFHMPVPEKCDPAEYMKVFIKHFEECLIQTKKEENSNG
jgi:hypothetical protein